MVGGPGSGMEGISYPFPQDNVNPKLKEKPEYGNRIASAIWYNRAFNNPYLFYNVRRDYYERINFALGLNNPDEYKPVLGINPREAQQTFLPNIDWSIKNYATKRVDIATAKILSRQYDPTFDPIDPFSMNRKKNYRSKLKAYMEQQQFLQEVNNMLGINAQATPEDVDPDLMPQNDTELDIHMKINYKDRAGSWLEKRCNYFMDRNRYSDIRSDGAFYEYVLGVRIEHVGEDSYGRPEIRCVNPAKYVGPYLPSQYPVNLPYGSDVDFYEIADARKLWEGEFTEAEEKHIIDTYATTEQLYYSNYQFGNNTASTKKIRILRFEYRSADEKVYVESKDQFGNDRFVERDFNFYRSKGQQNKFRMENDGRATLTRKKIDTVYAGYWIVDSDKVFKYRRISSQDGAWGTLGQGRLGYKVVAPNLKDGKVVSTIDQMIPVLRELQRLNLKVQHIVAASVPKGIAIDLDALRRADLEGPDGKVMSDLEKISFYQQTGVFVFNPGDGAIYGRGATGKPIHELENGMANDIVHYISLIREALNQLDEIIGLNEVSAASPTVHERKGARVAQMQGQATENALYYLYEADAHIYREVIKSLGISAIRSELAYPEYYIEAFGSSSADFIREFNMEKMDMGMRLEIQPTDIEWAQFYDEAKEAQQVGGITLSQLTLLKRVPTLKEAEALLRLFEERGRRQAADMKAADIEYNAKVQGEAAQQKHSSEMELKQIETQTVMMKVHGELQNTALEGENKAREIYLQAYLDNKLNSDKIRIQGDEDAQQIILKGMIDKDLKRIEAQNVTRETSTG